jgi:hypothetical protein
MNQEDEDQNKLFGLSDIQVKWKRHWNKKMNTFKYVKELNI